jgi:hypothetical protein
MSNKEKDLQTEKKPGLSIGEIKELNSLTTLNPDEKAAKSKRLAELRSIYTGNEYALRQLDIFDGNSEYNRKKKNMRMHSDHITLQKKRRYRHGLMYIILI